jgi:hypothetical protein
MKWREGVLTVPFIGPGEERSRRVAAGDGCSFKAIVF